MLSPYTPQLFPLRDRHQIFGRQDFASALEQATVTRQRMPLIQSQSL